MAFTDIKKIENYQFYLDKAIKRAQNKASLARQKKSKEERIIKSRNIELLKINIIADILSAELKDIIEKFPHVNQMDDFYANLVKATIDYGMLKKSVAALIWARKKVADFNALYSQKIGRCKDIRAMNNYRKQYYGRISSLMKQVKDAFVFLEEARKVIRNFPTIKTKFKTIAIAGFPNVGKTTLLTKLTGAKAEISNYAFTTKGINIGYFEIYPQKIQVIDTPGTLNRFNKMNMPEKQAYLALKYLADVIVYMFDLTEASYPLDQQKKLYDETKKLDKPMLVYFSKVDMLKDNKQLKKMSKKYDVISYEEFNEKIKKMLKKK